MSNSKCFVNEHSDRACSFVEVILTLKKIFSFCKWCDDTFCCCMNAEPGGAMCQDWKGPECSVGLFNTP